MERVDCSDDAVRLAAEIVVEAGNQIKRLDRTFEVKAGDGHRSGITKGDKFAQELITQRLFECFPNAVILSEEEGGSGNLILRDRPAGILEVPLAFVMDPIDGTAPYGSELGTWCVAVGVMRKGTIVGGAVYAPALNGGMLLVSDPGNPPVVAEWEQASVKFIEKISVPTNSKKCVVAFGADAVLYPSLTRFIPEIGTNVRVMALCNSGILGLAQVACKRIQTIIQSPQKVWDWVPAYSAMLRAGNIFQFFRLVPDEENPGQSRVEALEENQYDFKAFCYKPPESRLGFVAGEPEITRKIFSLMPKNNWAKLDPDTVTSNWK